MKNLPRNIQTVHKKEFVRIMDSLCVRYTRWEIWKDFVLMAAISISNAVDEINAEAREETYKSISAKYNPEELERFPAMLAEVVLGMEEEPDQDFLGDLFMMLELSSSANGQFFTPYSVCAMMAKMTDGEKMKSEIQGKGWISVSDPACGAGALLVAFANECRRQEIDYQNDVLFMGQDIDYVASCMCYIQLSLLGCAGYVVVGNTITNPSTSYDGKGLIPMHSENVWYTPMFFGEKWGIRRMLAKLNMTVRYISQEKKEEEAQ